MRAKRLTKEKRRSQIVEYLGNPDNEFLNRVEIAHHVLGYKQVQSLYTLFTLDEINEIEAEALEIRRKKYSKALSAVDKSVLREAKMGDMAAAKLAYQRFEGWQEKKNGNGVNLFLGDIKEIKIAFIDAKAPFSDEEPEGITGENVVQLTGTGDK